MSSLLVAADLDLMMLEISIEQLVVPRVSDFDAALLKKSIVMFRLLDKDWTSIHPRRRDYQVYRGSNSEIERFNGGVSVVFALPQSTLEETMENVDLQIHVHRELSKYFELQSSESIGVACVDVSDLFNSVIEGIKNRDENHWTREPVAKSSKDTYALVKEDGTESGANATIYLRLTHLGQSVISEIEVPEDPKRLFYAKKETSEDLSYQCREITLDELTSGCWGSETLVPRRNPRDTMCCCRGIKDAPKLPADNLNERKESEDHVESDTEEDADGDEEPSGIDLEKEKEGGDEKAEEIKEEVGGDEKQEEPEKSDHEETEDNESVDENQDDNEPMKVEKSEATKQEKEEAPTIPCLVKPNLCGKEGTCNKKDKKGKFGKCGKPDGEGGNPLACGELRKCARRKIAAGSATVGIVDKKISCPPPQTPRACPCAPVRSYPSPWSSPCNETSSPCSRCQPVYYGSSYAARPPNLAYHNYETPRYVNEDNAWRSMQVGWR